MFHIKPHTTVAALFKSALTNNSSSPRPVFLLVSDLFYNDQQPIKNQHRRQYHHFSLYSSGQTDGLLLSTAISTKRKRQWVESQNYIVPFRNKVTLSAPVALDESRTETRKEAKKVKLPKHIRFVANPYLNTENDAAISVDGTKPRPLLLMFGWMLAKESHMDKYREFWFKRGYDILSVRTSPMSLLLPLIGGKRNGETMYKFIASQELLYDEILVHAFSVGGYQLGEFCKALIDNQDRDTKAKQIYESLKGIIIDSCVFCQDAGPGLSRAITRHWLWQPLIEKSINAWLFITNPFTYKRYQLVQDLLFVNKSKIPGIVLYSKEDVVSSEKSNQELYRGWRAENDISRIYTWTNTPHVLLYKENPIQYEKIIDDFCEKIKMTKAKKLATN